LVAQKKGGAARAALPRTESPRRYLMRNSVPGARYCDRGAQCLRYDRTTGEPEKLSRYNKATICEACQRADRDRQERARQRSQASAAEKKTKERKPSAEIELPRLKQDLVLQLYRQEGSFWERVREMRERWGITAHEQVPPGNPVTLLYPEGYLLRHKGPAYYPTNPGNMDIIDVNHWEFELDRITAHVVPMEYTDAVRWREFMSACVLYDPPQIDLPGFAECGGEVPEGALPVYRMPDPWAYAGAYRKFYDQILREMGSLIEHRLHKQAKKLGLDAAESKELRRQLNIHEIFYEAMHTSGLLAELDEDLAQIPRDYYVGVNPRTNVQDMDRAHKMIRGEQDGPPRGARKRNPLTAIKCAVLHDDCGWDWPEIAEECGLLNSEGEPAAYSAEEHAKDGRKLRKSGRR
jgi:hypothetical protein